MQTMIEPLGFYVLVEPQEVKAVTAGGIHLPESTLEKEKAGIARGEILAAGPNAPQVKDHVGKTALFGRYAGVTVTEGGKDYRLIDAQDVRAVL